jgi:3-methyl-2-oxobutanoate hydroxymethyltransferase
MKSVLDFAAAKAAGRKISMVTCYDSSLARALEATAIDCILVGDSAAMVVHGHSDTLSATVEIMALHTAAVRRGAPTRFLIGDMPFLSFRKGVPAALDAVAALMRAGAQAVKLEGVAGHEDVIEAIVGSGIPVMGHLGLTPQSVNALAGYRVQGREEDDAVRIVEDARRLESLGCFSIVLECVPSTLGARITQVLTIPTIGVGAGVHCDGQVLVLQDLLGLTGRHRPKFVRTYLDGNQVVRDAVDRFDRDVKQGAFPAPSESYDA